MISDEQLNLVIRLVDKKIIDWSDDDISAAKQVNIKDVASELLCLRDLCRWRDARPGSKELPEKGQVVETLRVVRSYGTCGHYDWNLVIVRIYHTDDPRWQEGGKGRYRWWRPFTPPVEEDK